MYVVSKMNQLYQYHHYIFQVSRVMDGQYSDGVQIVNLQGENTKSEILSYLAEIPHFMQLQKRPIQLHLTQMERIVSELPHDHMMHITIILLALLHLLVSQEMDGQC